MTVYLITLLSSILFSRMAEDRHESDSSIGEKYKPYGEMLYFTLMHTFFSVAQKLSLSGKMLDMDTKKNGSIQLKLLADVLLGGLK